MHTIGDRLRWAREASGLSGRELGIAAGLSASHVWMIERGKRCDPTVGTMLAVARALGVSLDWLADGTGEQPDAVGLRRRPSRG